MNTGLQKLSTDFITARDEVGRVFRFEFREIHPVCANIFLSHGKSADAARIRECRDTIRNSAGLLNNFRGTVFAPCACMLACSGDPSGRMAQASSYYSLLKEYFFSSEPLVLASMLLTDLAAPDEAREKAERGRRLYQMMKEKHRFLTDQNDSVFAVLMAFSKKSDEELIDEVEAIMASLSGLAMKDYLQTVAQILAISDRPVEEKCARFRELYEALRAADIRYGKSYELAVLAPLCFADVPSAQIAADIAQVAGFLATQKGYGLFSADKKTRYMHAAMLVSTYYSPSAEGNIAAIASMVSIVAIEILMIVILTSHAARMIASTN